MARILCNVAGGGKPLKGNAETGDVLAGKTFSNKQSNALTGSMPNNGALNVTLTPSGNGSTSQAVAAGYYSGGTITANGSSSYNSGYTNGWNACRQAAMTNVYVTVKADAQYAGKDAVVFGWGSSSLTKSYGKTGSHKEDNGDNRYVSANIISWGGMPDAK